MWLNLNSTASALRRDSPAGSHCISVLTAWAGCCQWCARLCRFPETPRFPGPMGSGYRTLAGRAHSRFPTTPCWSFSSLTVTKLCPRQWEITVKSKDRTTWLIRFDPHLHELTLHWHCRRTLKWALIHISVSLPCQSAMNCSKHK